MKESEPLALNYITLMLKYIEIYDFPTALSSFFNKLSEINEILLDYERKNLITADIVNEYINPLKPFNGNLLDTIKNIRNELLKKVENKDVYNKELFNISIEHIDDIDGTQFIEMNSKTEAKNKHLITLNDKMTDNHEKLQKLFDNFISYIIEELEKKSRPFEEVIEYTQLTFSCSFENFSRFMKLTIYNSLC